MNKHSVSLDHPCAVQVRGWNHGEYGFYTVMKGRLSECLKHKDWLTFDHSYQDHDVRIMSIESLELPLPLCVGLQSQEICC